MKSRLIDPPRRIQIPHVRTPEPDQKFGELALLTAVSVLSAVVVGMAMSGLFR